MDSHLFFPLSFFSFEALAHVWRQLDSNLVIKCEILKHYLSLKHGGGAADSIRKSRYFFIYVLSKVFVWTHNLAFVFITTIINEI